MIIDVNTASIKSESNSAINDYVTMKIKIFSFLYLMLLLSYFLYQLMIEKENNHNLEKAN